MARRRGIKVKITRHALGYCLLRPVVDRYAEVFREHMKAMGQPNSDSAYVRHLEDLRELISPEAYHDLQSGWDATCIMDPWELGHCYGWDAHTIVEKGDLR